MYKSLSSILGIFIFLLTFVHASLAGELEQSIKAHGSLSKFREYGSVEYDQNFDYTGVFTLTDHQLIDLNSRNVLLTSDGYKIGFDGQEAWIAPDTEALPLPPRFYASTPLYFFGLPFLFADPGVNAESLGSKILNGKEYNVVKFTYDEGIGDTPKDDYIAFFDKDTNRMEIVNYIVTYPPLMQGKSIEELERHTAVYDEWQEAGGLSVPKKISFYEWADEKPGTERIGMMEFDNVIFNKTSPSPSVFQKPEGAKVDNSHIGK